MADSTQPTAEQRMPPTVVAVGLSVQVLDYTRYAAAAAGAKRVETCGVDAVSTTVARWRPFAIVVASSLYGFDAREFDALAQDVHAQIITVPEEDPDVEGFVKWMITELEGALAKTRGVVR